MKLIEALEWRYAVKKMNGNKIPADKLNTIIEATRLAPSAFGLTPYTIIVVEDEETRKKLQPAFYNQSQVVDGSAVIVFAAWNNVTEKEVAEYMQDIADQRGVPVESLNDFAGYINGALKNLTPSKNGGVTLCFNAHMSKLFLEAPYGFKGFSCATMS